MIKVEKLSKTFGSGPDVIHALKEVDLEVFPGQITLIVGPSGSGKTTLLSCIAGTLHGDSGSLKVLGYQLDALTVNELCAFRAKHIGYIFQEYHLIPTLTCVENVAIPLLIQNWPRDKAFTQAKKMLEKVGLATKFDRRPTELSGGQEQRVAIARAVVHEPPLLICDEPTSALDWHTSEKILELLQELAKNENRSVIIVTHDHRIFPYAAHIIEIDDGCIKNILKN